MPLFFRISLLIVRVVMVNKFNNNGQVAPVPPLYGWTDSSEDTSVVWVYRVAEAQNFRPEVWRNRFSTNNFKIRAFFCSEPGEGKYVDGDEKKDT